MQVFFLFFCTFFRTIQEPRIFRVCTHFFVSSLFYFFYIYNSNLFSVNVLKKHFTPSIPFVLLSKEKARHLLMSCSFFLVCHWEVFLVALQFAIIYKAGECSSEEEVYILIGVYRCKTVLGGNSRQQLNCNHNQSCHLT